MEYDELKSIQWNWESVNGVMTKSPLGGEKTRKYPTDYGKLRAKHSVLTDSCGVPLGVDESGTKMHNIKLFEITFNSVSVQGPQPTRRRNQQLCLDKGYDSDDVRKFLRRRHYRMHVKSRGQEAAQRKTNPRFKARRWVV